MKSFFLSFIVFFSSINILAQTNGVHSHNDYLQNNPFWDAYKYGANSIEADVILKNEKLYVAHEEKAIQENKTLETLYLNPILSVFKEHKLEPRPFILMIDIKREPEASMREIVKSLQSVKEYLYPKNKNGVKIIISGDKPELKDYSKYPDFIYFDYQYEKLPEDISKIGMQSLDFKTISNWNGMGRLTKEDEDRIGKILAVAKKQHIPFRFWGTPDSKTAWYTLKTTGIDFIGTDSPAEATAYLNNLDKNSVRVQCSKDGYLPTQHSDNSNTKIKNIILLIGDGMGLAQISSFTLACPNAMMNQFHYIGLSKTNSADDFTTESAAGGTAIATGQKTNNRYLGVNPKGEKIKNIAEILADKGYNIGLVTTDEINGATPAAFYAHTDDRSKNELILNDLAHSSVKFIAGGGRKLLQQNNFENTLKSKGFEFIKNLNEINSSNQKIAYITANGGVDYIREGRGDYLPKTTKKAIDFLKSKNFFLMVEGAQIDNFGHFNDVKGIVEETADFDNAIREALKFADQDGHTLVIVTADHETGGLSLPHGTADRTQIEGSFTTHDHTGVMVPVFVYGPKASEFQGIYENTEIFNKILKVLQIQK